MTLRSQRPSRSLVGGVIPGRPAARFRAVSPGSSLTDSNRGRFTFPPLNWQAAFRSKLRGAALAKLLLGTAAALFIADPARAHDLWIEPETFAPVVGTLVPVRLRVGQDFQGDSVPRSVERIERFALVGAGGESAVEGPEGGDPAGVARVEEMGCAVLVYRSTRASIELPAAKFKAYLKEEGLERISEARAGRGESHVPGREVYSRCAKSIVTVIASTGDRSRTRTDPAGGASTRIPGAVSEPERDPAQGSGISAARRKQGGVPAHPRREGTGAAATRPVGLTLELVPEVDPTHLPAGRELPVRLLYEGKPLAGALVVAMSREAPAVKLRARTDRHGRVSLALPRRGVWLVKAVHMVPAPRGVPADWESLWASLTFEIPGT